MSGDDERDGKIPDSVFRHALRSVLRRRAGVFASLAAHDQRHAPTCFARPLCPDVTVAEHEGRFVAACASPRLEAAGATEVEALAKLRVHYELDLIDVGDIEARERGRQAKDPFRARMLARFPLLYVELAAESTNRAEPITREGFAVGPGWQVIVERLSAQIAALVELLPAEERARVRVVQVKEKFGALRVYLDETTEQISAVIDAASNESLRTCEECGGLGELRNRRGWVSVRCDGCWTLDLEAKDERR